MKRPTLKATAVLALIIMLAGATAVGWGTTITSTADLSANARGSEAMNVVDVNIRGMKFDAPKTVPSGWTTFRLHNESDMIHFAAVERLPEGITLEDQQDQVAPVFQQGMDLLNAGKVDAAMAAFGTLPEWFGNVVFKGGPGFISAGKTAQTTVFLEPGTYLLECYVKTGGTFHSYSPSPDQDVMVHEITVTENASGAPQPKATIDLAISGEGGIDADDMVRPGRHTVAVHFESQQTHEHFLGHDVQLVQLTDDTVLDELATWMDWTQPTGLETPAPATFLGGTQEMPAGSTAYFEVLLAPGRYAWLAEVPNAIEKKMLRTFTVPNNRMGEE